LKCLLLQCRPATSYVIAREGGDDRGEGIQGGRWERGRVWGGGHFKSGRGEGQTDIEVPLSAVQTRHLLHVIAVLWQLIVRCMCCDVQCDIDDL
jgi:hypothetical protein